MPKAAINTSITEAIGLAGKVGCNLKTVLLGVSAPSLAETDSVFLDLMMHLHVFLYACCCSEISPDAI